nr:integrase, catalytic region, zinc finger, CCHC-type, peptidase aspartic, catalytic [Tanacetum cinerariifolium]
VVAGGVAVMMVERQRLWNDGDRVVFVVVGLWWGMMVLRGGGGDNDGYKVVVAAAVDGDEGGGDAYGIYTVKRLVPAKSNSYYQVLNVKSLFGEIDCLKKSQVKLEGTLPMLQPRSSEVKFILSSSQCKKDKYKPIAIKTKIESSDEDTYTSGSEDEEYVMAVRDFKSSLDEEVCLKAILELDKYIKDSGCSKHMIGNKNLFSSYQAYQRGNVIFESNLNGQIIDKVVGDGVAGIKRRRRDLYCDGVRNFMTASRRSRIKDDLESSTWRRRQDF